MKATITYSLVTGTLTEAEIKTEDGGVSTIHHNGEFTITKSELLT